jgi:hypothetical protein
MKRLVHFGLGLVHDFSLMRKDQPENLANGLALLSNRDGFEFTIII